MNRDIVLYGIALAGIALILQWIEYYHFIRVFSTEIFIVFVALVFTSLGVWTGQKLTSAPSPGNAEFRKNVKAIEYLGLSGRELEVLELLIVGKSNRQIANEMYISVNTVKTHVSNILGKLGVQNRTEAIHKARSLRLIR